MTIEVERTFGPQLSTPAAVRAFVSEMLSLWGYDGFETACLLSSELATNAVLHAGTGITVRISLSDSELMVEVEDGSSKLPEPVALTPESERGRGLFLIQALSGRWGADRCARGKIVWFEMPVVHRGGDPALNGRRQRRAAV
jgi:hypothetical protein